MMSSCDALRRGGSGEGGRGRLNGRDNLGDRLAGKLFELGPISTAGQVLAAFPAGDRKGIDPEKFPEGFLGNLAHSVSAFGNGVSVVHALNYTRNVYAVKPSSYISRIMT